MDRIESRHDADHDENASSAGHVAGTIPGPRRWASLLECDDPNERWAGAPISKVKQFTPS